MLLGNIAAVAFNWFTAVSFYGYVDNIVNWSGFAVFQHTFNTRYIAFWTFYQPHSFCVYDQDSSLKLFSYFAETTKKLTLCNQCKDYIRYISRHAAPQKLIIRGILEASLSPQYNVVFGSAIESPPPFQPRIYATDEKLVCLYFFKLLDWKWEL